MLIKTIPVGHLDTNCYVVTNEQTLESVVIDPGDEGNTILDYLESNKLKCLAIMLTHGHYDHVGAVSFVAEETGAVVYMNRRDDRRYAPEGSYLTFELPENGISYDDGDVIELAGLRFYIMATPGHTPGGVTIRCEDALFTGDTLFCQSCGRTDLPGGSWPEILQSLKKLYQLPGDYQVLPGHEGLSTLERERKSNPYMRQAVKE